MDNLTPRKVGALLNRRKLVSIDKLSGGQHNEGLCFSFDCEDGKTIPLLLIPREKDNELFIDIVLGTVQTLPKRRKAMRHTH